MFHKTSLSSFLQLSEIRAKIDDPVIDEPPTVAGSLSEIFDDKEPILKTEIEPHQTDEDDTSKPNSVFAEQSDDDEKVADEHPIQTDEDNTSRPDSAFAEQCDDENAADKEGGDEKNVAVKKKSVRKKKQCTICGKIMIHLDSK
jgi:hypothetical protein